MKSADTQIPQHEQTAGRDISIWLDGYDDLFSDFDPRPLFDRNISDDFMYEVRKVSRESHFQIKHLKLLVPAAKRNEETEEIITKRLHSFFRNNHQHFLKQKKSEKRKGSFFALLGISLMLSASYVSSLQSESFFKRLLFVVMEPAGWFMVWTGFELLFYPRRLQKTELDFYDKLAGSKIVFENI
jgi:hypothetical protein